MDKVDLCLIPFIYLLRLTLNILSVVIFLMPTPANLGKAIQNGITWNWKERRKDSKAAKRKASKIEPELDPAPVPSTYTLALAKLFKSILTFKVQMSNAEATYLIDTVVANADEKKMAAKE